MIAYRDFWTVPVDEVPMKTGAAGVMDCADILDVLDHLAIDLSEKSALDVGCGTGRMARLCGQYTGVDVSPSMVEYAVGAGCDAFVVDGPADLLSANQPAAGYDIVLCLSVFTHISRDDRRAYLAAFEELAPLLLVDILPGVEGGYPGVWFADRQAFEDDLAEAGYSFEAYSRTSLDAADHAYYSCRA